MTMVEKDSRAKDWMQAMSYLVGTGHWYYPPNSYQATSENFVQIDPSIQKVFSNFCSMMHFIPKEYQNVKNQFFA